MTIIINIGENVPLVGTNMNSLHILSLNFHSDHRKSSYESHCTEETRPHRLSLCSHRQTDVRTWILLSLSSRYILFRSNLTNSLNVQTLWPSNSRISLKEVINAMRKLYGQESVALYNSQKSVQQLRNSIYISILWIQYVL